MKKNIALFAFTFIILATPTLAEEKTPPSVKDTKFNDWTLRLSADPNRDTINHMFTGSRSKDGQYRLEVGVLYAHNAKDWVVVYQFNSTADKEKGVEIAFPSGIKGNIPISRCNEEFCQAEVSKNTAAFLEYMKNNPKATLTFIDKEKGTPVPMAFSLNGFGKAFEELQKSQKSAKKDGADAPIKTEAGSDLSTQD